MSGLELFISSGSPIIRFEHKRRYVRSMFECVYIDTGWWWGYRLPTKSLFEGWVQLLIAPVSTLVSWSGAEWSAYYRAKCFRKPTRWLSNMKPNHSSAQKCFIMFTQLIHSSFVWLKGILFGSLRQNKAKMRDGKKCWPLIVLDRYVV